MTDVQTELEYVLRETLRVKFMYINPTTDTDGGAEMHEMHSWCDPVREGKRWVVEANRYNNNLFSSYRKK